MKMKILRIIPSMNPSSGGPCQGLRNIIPELEKIGIENEVVCLDDPTSSFLGKDSFKIHAIGPASNSWAYNKNLIPWLITNLGRFDVVVVHALWLYHGYAFNRALHKFNLRAKNGKTGRKSLKAYIMPHGMLDPYFQKAEGRKLKALRNWIYWKLIESKVVNNSSGVLFTCETELLLARKTFTPYHPKKEINIGYGIAAPPLFERSMKAAFLEKCPAVSGTNYLLFLSRIHVKKGLDQLLKAYELIVTRVPDFPALVVAGPGAETPYGQLLLQVVNESEYLRERVFFAGMLTGKAKWGACYGSEAFVLTSHQENFGIAVVESLACGKLVLISDQVNIWREIIAAGAGMVSAATVEGVLAMLQNWHDLSLEQKKKMQQEAANTFEKYYAINTAANRFASAVSI